MTITTTTPAIEHKSDFIKMRKAGYTYRDIGRHFGISHERVRQILAEDGGASAWARTSARDKRETEIATITAWLDEHGPVERAVVLDHFGMTASRLTTLIAEGLPSHKILMTARDTTPQFSDEQVGEALNAAWAELLKVNPTATGLSYVMYERLRGPGSPSAPLLVARFGWEDACEKFGIPAGESWRAKTDYISKWTDEGILRVVAEYANSRIDAGARPSYLGYERWQQERAHAPSGTLVRNRMRDTGLTTWPQIVKAALSV